jgi:hypothetical protein
VGSSLLLDLSSILVRRNLIELRLYEGRSLGVCPISLGCNKAEIARETHDNDSAVVEDHLDQL